MIYKSRLKLNRRKNLYLLCFAVVLLFSQEAGVSAGSPASKSTAPDGWPAQLGKRKLYSFEHAFIYAGRKSDAAEVNKRIEAAIEELDKDGVQNADTIIGLALITDTKEKPLVSLQKIIEVLREVDKKQQSEKSKKDLKSMVEAKEDLEKEGIDMDMVLSITPVPIEPNLLPGMVSEFPEDVDNKTDFCVFVPTVRNVKFGFKKILDAAIKQKKIGIVERLALVPLMPFVEGKVVDGIKKSEQLVVYEFLMEKQKHLTKEQREEKIKAYKKKLGLGDDSKSYQKDGDPKK
jgi:hypothetical protein